jgi:hypothetical protein
MSNSLAQLSTRPTKIVRRTEILIDKLHTHGNILW